MEALVKINYCAENSDGNGSDSNNSSGCDSSSNKRCLFSRARLERTAKMLTEDCKSALRDSHDVNLSRALYSRRS